MIRFGLKYRVKRSIIAYLKINLLTGDLEQRVSKVMESLVSSAWPMLHFPPPDSCRPRSLHYLTIVFADMSSFHLDLHLNSQHAHLIFLIKLRYVAIGSKLSENVGHWANNVDQLLC